jgi:hypothetical protein
MQARQVGDMECPNEEVHELSKVVLTDFDKRVDALPVDLCAPFHNEAARLEVELLVVYRLTVLRVRATDDLSKIADLWRIMVAFSDEATKRLAALNAQHPNCGAEIYYDRLLDLRNKCNRLHQMHK